MALLLSGIMGYAAFSASRSIDRNPPRLHSERAADAFGTWPLHFDDGHFSDIHGNARRMLLIANGLDALFYYTSWEKTHEV